MMPINRVQGFFSRMTPKATTTKADQAEPKTVKPIGRNLQFEIDRSPFDPQQVFKIVCESVKNLGYTEVKPPKRKTFDRWLAGENEPTPIFRDILAKLFKYPDPKSILEPDHIDKRSLVPPEAKAKPSSAADFGQFMSFMGTSMAKSDQEVIASLKRLLEDPEKRHYARLAIDWLSR